MKLPEIQGASSCLPKKNIDRGHGNAPLWDKSSSCNCLSQVEQIDIGMDAKETTQSFKDAYAKWLERDESENISFWDFISRELCQAQDKIIVMRKLE